MNINPEEELDFAYLLELMQPLHSTPEFALLPELFSIIGDDSLIKLCKYVGGETVTIPTIEQLTASLIALQWFYKVRIKKSEIESKVPDESFELYQKICKVYDEDA